MVPVEDMKPARRRRPGFRGTFARAARARLRARQPARRTRARAARGARVGARSPARSPIAWRATWSCPPSDKQILLETLGVEERMRRLLIYVQRQHRRGEGAAGDPVARSRRSSASASARSICASSSRRSRRSSATTTRRASSRSWSKRLASPRLAGEGAQGGRSRAVAPRAHRRRGHGSPGHPQLPRVDVASCPGTSAARTRSISSHAKEVLEADHYGLDDVKDRVLEFLGGAQARGRECGPSGERSEARAKRRRRRAEADERTKATRAGSPRALGGQGADPAVRRSARRGQDLDRRGHRQGARPRVRAHRPRRRARRGRHPRPPSHLRGRHARSHHPGPEAGRHQEPRVLARRGRQARRVLPGRSVRRRCSRCSTPRRTTPSPITT